MGTEDEVRAASEQFYLALNSILDGDFEPMNEIWSHSPKATEMGPAGGVRTGWNSIREELEAVSEMKIGGHLQAEDLQVHADDDFGLSVCTETGEINDAGGHPISIKYRATNVFVREEGAWKLLHRHADLEPALQTDFE